MKKYNYLTNALEKGNVTNSFTASAMSSPVPGCSEMEFKNRVINLFGPFDEPTVNGIMEKLLKWEEEDAEILYKHSQQIRQLEDPTQLLKPIIININSPGGYVNELMALVDMLESMPCPVITRAYGQVCSCGFVLFCVGDERYVGNNTTLMYHELAYGIWGKDSEIKAQHDYSKKLQKRIDKLIAKKTGLKLKQLDAWKKEVHDKYFDAQEAVDLGIATDLLY